MLKDPKKYRYIIGIDPSISSDNSKKTGVCIYDQEGQRFYKIFGCNAAEMVMNEIQENTIFDLPKEECLVLIENSNESKRIRRGFSIGQTAKINQNAGKNLGVSEFICQCFDFSKVNYNSIPPNGYSKLFENAEFFQKTLSLEKKYNKDARAAVAIVFKNVM